MKDMKEMTGVTFNGSVTFNGPMFDIHDNDHVTIVSSEREGKTKTEEKSETPAELQTEEARRLWDAARDAGWVDDGCQPLLSRSLSALLADRMATLLNIQNKWKVFESFWGMKGLRSAYNNALNQKQFDEFYEKLKNNIR
jgi:hypothetical protein